MAVKKAQAAKKKQLAKVAKQKPKAVAAKKPVPAKKAAAPAQKAKEIRPIQRPVTGETPTGKAVPPDKKAKKKLLAKIAKKEARLNSGNAKNPERLQKRIDKLKGKVPQGGKGKGGGKGRTPADNKLDTNIAQSDDRAAEQIEKGLEVGRKIGEEFYPEGALGRLDVGRTAEDAELIAMRKANLAGLSDQEVRGIRETGQRDINVQVQQARRNVLKRLAQTSSRGNAAAAALGDVERERVQAQAGLTQGILNRNIDLKREALGAYENTVGAQKAFDREGNVFNLGAQAAEVGGRAGAAAQGIGLQTGISAGMRAEDLAQQSFDFQKKEAKRSRKHQLALLEKQLQSQRDMFAQARADATASF